MLPNRMSLPKKTEDRLRRIKQYTGISPNIFSRIAFFRSIESGYLYQNERIALDGPLVLDKVTWLGETMEIAELLLAEHYPELEAPELREAWAAHVTNGILGLHTVRKLSDLQDALMNSTHTITYNDG